jgi:two-component system copper resistance phosphate regulon response regulator CusR
MRPHESCSIFDGVRILVVEDEQRIASFIQRGLTEQGHAVDIAYDGEEGLYLAEVHDYDVLLLDILLPKKSGFEVCEELRRRHNSTPILMLTARGAISDRIRGLDSGADDYLVKPFAFEELLARVRALGRRPRDIAPDVLKVGDLEISRSRQTARRGGTEISLTAKEFSLLEYLMQHPNQIVTRTAISEHVWDQHFDSMTNVIDVYIKRLRDKLDRGFRTRLLHTRRGRGYVFGVQDEA